MANATTKAREQIAFCRDCGAKIQEKAEICPECGIRQKEKPGHNVSGGLMEQYSVAIWIVAVLFGLLTFPIGLIIPAYLYIKASNGTGAEQGGWESWTVVLLGILGIAAVEIGGEKGAKVLWGIIGAMIAFVFLIAIALI